MRLTKAESVDVPSYHKESGMYDTIGLTCETVVLTAVRLTCSIIVAVRRDGEPGGGRS